MRSQLVALRSPLPCSESWSHPILGGTGAHAGAHGYVKLRDLGNGQGNSADEFHLL
jgi:hypothetical protein